MAIHYSPTPRCCVPALHRASLSRSLLAPSIFFRTPTLRLVSVRSQASGSDAVGSAKKHSHAAVGLSSSSSVIDFLTLCHRLKVPYKCHKNNHLIFPVEFVFHWFYLLLHVWLGLPVLPPFMEKNKKTMVFVILCMMSFLYVASVG